MSASRLLGLASRNLLRQRRRTAVAASAMVVGLVALLLLAGFTRGFLDYVVRSLVLGRFGAVLVQHQGYQASAEGTPLGLALDDGPAFRARLAAVPGVRAVSARVLFSGVVSDGRTQVPVVARGVEPLAELAVCPSVFDGATAALAPADTAAAIVGAGLYRAMGLVDGAPLTFSVTGAGGRANALTASVKGRVGAFFALDAARVATVPLGFAQALTGLEGRVTEYALAVDDVWAAGEVAQAVRDALGPGYDVTDWMGLIGFVRASLEYMGFLMAFAGILLGVVVATGVSNLMLMSVHERTREIGAQLAVGMRRRTIGRLFLLEAAVLGACSALAGVVLGGVGVMVLGRVGIPVRYLGLLGDDVLRMAFDARIAAWGAVGVVLTAVVAAWLPARRAAKLSPVDALGGRLR